MRVCKLRLDRARNVWLHEPSGIQITHWVSAARDHDPTPEDAKAKALELFEQRLGGKCELVFLDEPFPASGRMTEVRMTNFGGARIPGV